MKETKERSTRVVMRSLRVWGGILYYGSEAVKTAVVVGGEKHETPKWVSGLSANRLGIYRHRSVTPGSPRRLWVVNFSHPWFACGISTSGGLGVVISAQGLLKRGGEQAGDTHRRYRGVFAQIGFGLVKAYLYVYPDGDGLK